LVYITFVNYNVKHVDAKDLRWKLKNIYCVYTLIVINKNDTIRLLTTIMATVRLVFVNR